MQQIISERPYQFVPPLESKVWRRLIEAYTPRYLDRCHGVTKVECRGTGHLAASLAAGHGILLTPNHCRPPDPFVMGMLSRAVHEPFYVVASWHLFTQSRMQTWLLRHAGAFSIYREGMDRAAVNASIDILTHAQRPLVIFPEGMISRTNDNLCGLMEGTALIARTAAKRRAKTDPAPGTPSVKSEIKNQKSEISSPGVVVHPVALRYFFEGDLPGAIEPVLAEIEGRLTWQPRRDRPLMERIHQIGEALLSLKEIEYLGRARPGGIPDRQAALVDFLLVPLERRWLGGAREPHTAARVKRLRQAILPDMVKGELPEDERETRWRQLADLYLAQQVALYPPDYVQAHAVAERFLGIETK